jgi:hypothetical protein
MQVGAGSIGKFALGGRRATAGALPERMKACCGKLLQHAGFVGRAPGSFVESRVRSPDWRVRSSIPWVRSSGRRVRSS